MSRRMRLVAYLKTGPTANHGGGWRHPDSPLHDIFDASRYEHLARLLEAACFDLAFFADTNGIPDVYKGGFDTYLRHGGQVSYLEPLTVLPFMIRVTRHIGLATTLSTTFNHPYQLARTLASLDHLSGGRIGWNVVTSATDFEARNFGQAAIPSRDDRYDRADEVLEACSALWEGWDEDALVLDRAGLFADPAKVRYADYRGRHVATRGPLTVPRSPQGRPVLMQAGSSGRGRAFAARWAELIFTTPSAKPDAQAIYADLRRVLADAGRDPANCPILPAASVVLADTKAEAEDRAAALNALLDPELMLAANSGTTGIDLSKPDATDSHQGIQGARDRVAAGARQQGVSFAEAARRPRRLMVGTAATVADQMQDWFEDGACDGFILWPVQSPGTFEDVTRLLVPELQRRGLVQTSYRGQTLRERLTA